MKLDVPRLLSLSTELRSEVQQLHTDKLQCYCCCVCTLTVSLAHCSSFDWQTRCLTTQTRRATTSFIDGRLRFAKLCTIAAAASSQLPNTCGHTANRLAVSTPHPPYPPHLYTSTPHTSRPHTQHSDAALVADIDKRTTDVMINIINRTLTPERGFYDLVFFPLTGALMQPPPSLLLPLTITLLLLLLFVQMLVQSACCCHEALTRTRCLSAATVRCTSRPSKATSPLQPPSSSMVPM